MAEGVRFKRDGDGWQVYRGGRCLGYVEPYAFRRAQHGWVHSRDSYQAFTTRQEAVDDLLRVVAAEVHKNT